MLVLNASYPNMDATEGYMLGLEVAWFRGAFLLVCRTPRPAMLTGSEVI